MANVKISQLTTYSGTDADLRWFVMNNSGETSTFKYSGYTSPLRVGNGSNSVINNYNASTTAAGAFDLNIGGSGNTITSTLGTNTIVGGRSNTLSSSSAGNHSNGMLGGDGNTITSASYASAIAAGQGNSITNGYYSFIAGRQNVINGTGSYPGAIVGASNATITNSNGTIIAGYGNTLTAAGSDSAIFGGRNNNISGAGDPGNHIVGGSSNTIDNSPGTKNVIVGGESNNVRSSSFSSGVFGGSTNTISSSGGRNAIIASTGSQVTGTTANAVMIGTQTRNADRGNCVFVENLKLFNYASLNFADDTAAAAGGVVLGQVYHNNGAMRIRIA